MRTLVVWALAAAVLVVSGCSRAPLGGRASDPAPQFTLRQFTGADLSLGELRGRAVVVNFWASWCIPCRQEMPLLEEASKTEDGRDVAFIGIAIEDDEISLRAFRDAFRITYPTGLDLNGSIANAYQVVGLPTTIFISPSGALYRKWQGPLDRDRLMELIKEARASS